MSELIERIVDLFRERLSYEWDVVNHEDQKAICRDLVRIALLTIRVPTETMKAVGEDTIVTHSWGNRGEFICDPEAIWEVMIDAALKD